jgi:hypothetical protein
MRAAVGSTIAEATIRGFDEQDEERYSAEAEEREGESGREGEGETQIAEEGVPVGVPLVPALARDLGERILENLGELQGGYRRRHIDVKLDSGASEFVTRLFRGLNEGDARLASGRHVTSPADAVRWLLEQCIVATAGS